MRIGIMGTRGIPNKYGGFEQFAMYFSEYLVEQGHQVVVYNSAQHPYQHSTWNGVEIKHIYDPEKIIGSAGQFVYDLFSILDTRKQNFDVIFQLGYTSSSLWSFLFPKKATLITNMDGMEWKRSKYNKLIKSYLRKAERWAVKKSDLLISDSLGIQDYLMKKYSVKSAFIAYGATVFSEPDLSILSEFGLQEKAYNLLIARLEPENNIEMIIQGHILSENKTLQIIGNPNTKYGQYLKKKYESNVNFMGAIYDINVLNNLRYYCLLYFHGHSVGGTNPSLLEAMACQCSIVAHNNIFNQSVLQQSGLYINSPTDVQAILLSHNQQDFDVEKNVDRIKTDYSFETIHTKLSQLLQTL